MKKKFNESYIGIRMDLLKHVKGENLKVLDIGCATGENIKYLRGQGMIGYSEGLEIDQKMAKLAKFNIEKVVVGDINNQHVFNELSDIEFDIILIGDVLEHLNDPWQILQKLTLKLKDKGKVVFSVPNISHIDVFIHVFIKGYWPYNERGIFDKTHIRMFTKQNIKELVESAKLTLSKLDRNYRYRDKIGSSFPFYGIFLKKLFPDLYTFQYIAVCEKSK